MRKRLSASERHDRKHAEHKRYYAQTAFKYERRKWTDDEDKLVLIQRIPDSELSPIIKRSMKSISNRRVQGLGCRQREGIIELVAKLK